MTIEFPLMPVCPRCQFRHYLADADGRIIADCPFDDADGDSRNGGTEYREWVESLPDPTVPAGRSNV